MGHLGCLASQWSVPLARYGWAALPLNLSKIGHLHMNEAFAYLFGRNIFIRLLSANKISPVDLLKLAITGNFTQINPWFWDPNYSFFPRPLRNLFVESQINPKFPVTSHFKRSAGECLFADRRQMKIFQQNRWVCKCFIWVTNLGTIHGKVLPNCFLPRQTIKVEALFQWWLTSKQHNTKPTKTNQKTRANQLI